MNFVRTISIFSAVAASTMAASVWAAGNEQHDSHHPAATATTLVAQAAPTTPGIGMAGDSTKVSRTIPIEMNDTMRFTPGSVSVKAGETVRFFIVNKGKVPHEMVIGTADEIDEHAEMMKKMPGMTHKEPNQITLAPGQRGGIVWQFAKAGTVTYACLVPGHKEAGMVGTINVN